MQSNANDKYDEYLKLAISITDSAGKSMQDGFNSTTTHWKKDNTPVTEIDLQINQYVIEEIKKQFPEHSILGEEQDYNGNDEDYVWICDPIDGTRSFSIGMHSSVFALALTYQGEPILGVILDPFTDRLLSATKDNGSYLNQSQQLLVSEKSDLTNSTLGIPYKNSFKYNIRDSINRLWDMDAIIYNTFSVLYMGTFVAEGKFDAVVLPSDKGYDSAALQIIVEEAGGKVTDLFGENLNYNSPISGMIASNGKVHDELVEVMKTVKSW